MNSVTNIFSTCFTWTQNHNCLHSDVATVISVNFKLLLCLVQEFRVIQLFASRQRWTSGGEIDRLSCSFLHLVGKVRAPPPYTVTLK